MRWTNPDQFHVTLRFIGDVDLPQARRFEDTLRAINGPRGWCVPYGLDVLPSRRTPRVLMVGLEPTDSIIALHDAVSDALEAEDLAPEDRDYRPHITLGRLDNPDPEAVHAFLQTHDEISLPAFRADQIVLYESTLTPNGARHEPRATYPLSA